MSGLGHSLEALEAMVEEQQQRIIELEQIISDRNAEFNQQQLDAEPKLRAAPRYQVRIPELEAMLKELTGTSPWGYGSWGDDEGMVCFYCDEPEEHGRHQPDCIWVKAQGCLKEQQGLTPA